MNNNELDEILASLQKDKEKLNDLLNIEPVEMPKAKPIEPAPIPIEPPKPINQPVAKPEPAPAPKPAKKAKDKKVKEKKVKNGTKKYFKATFSKDFKKLAKRIVAIILAIAIIITGGLFIANKAKYGYIRDYEKQYGIDFPKHIQEEFCNEYAKNQSIRGSLTIENEKQYVEERSNTSNPYLDSGSSIDADQQFSSIRASKNDFDAESIYSSSKGYLDSSQEIVFNTLYEKQTYQVIACYYTNTKLSNGDDYIYPYNIYGNMTQRSFVEFEDKIRSRELFDTGYKFNYYDKFISIAIDSDFMEDYVFVIVGVKVDGKVKKYTNATDNKKVHYPKSYYESKNEHNPYRFAKKWQPEMLEQS